MKQITTISDDADQLVYFILDDGSVLKLEFICRPSIQRWSVNVSHPLITLNGYNLCLSPNILRPWKNLIPFGIAVTSLDGVDPVDIDDFSSGRVQIFILSAEDVAAVETDILAVAA